MPRLLSCACLLLLTANVLDAQKYAIRLSPPDHVGDRYRLAASGTRLQRASISKDGQVLQDATTEYRVDLNALVEVLEVDRKGEAIRKTITIDKMTKSEKGVETEVLKPGTVVYTDGARPKDKQVSLMSGPLEGAVREALDLVVTNHRPNSPTDDELFGTVDQQGIGESWSINRQLAAEDLVNNGMLVSAESLSGKVSLTGKETLAGVDCLSIAATLTANELRPPSLPPGTTIEQGVVRFSFAGCYPLAEAALPNRQSVDMAIQIRAKGTAGSPMEGRTVDITFQQKLLSTKVK
jgi:hypothetical protein